MKKKVIAAGIAVLLIALAAFRLLGGREETVTYESRPTVTLETPQANDIVLYTEMIGTVEPVSKADVIPKMAGEILEVNFQAGDHVEAGQVLCRIDSDALDSLKLNMDAAQITLEEARRSRDRIEALYGSGAVSQQELEQVRDGAESARIAYEAAKNQYDLQVEYTTVTAPISGTVETRNVDIHDFASAGVPVCTIASDGQFQVKFGVTDKTHANISVGDSVTLEKNGTVYDAQITEISSMIDAATGLYNATAVLSNPADLTNGMRVKLTVVREQALGTQTVPLAAIHYDAGAPYVYCYQDGTAVRTDVEAGIHDEERMEILGGLTAESQVITSWSNELVDGAEVLIKEAGEAQ